MAKLTREQQIRQGLAILDPSGNEREWYTRQITVACNHVKYAPIKSKLSSVANKKLFQKMEAELRNVRTISRQLQLIDLTEQWDQLPPLLQEWIGWCKKRIDLPPSPRKLRFRSAHAVEMAWLLLWDRDLPITRGRRSLWLKLATILYGCDDVDLYGSLK